MPLHYHVERMSQALCIHLFECKTILQCAPLKGVSLCSVKAAHHIALYNIPVTTIAKKAYIHTQHVLSKCSHVRPSQTKGSAEM